MLQKTILITGASTGFGKLTVIESLKAGDQVIAGIRGGWERFNQIAQSESDPEVSKLFLESLQKKNLFIVDLHLDSPETFSSAIRIIEREFNGTLDVLVNNAGFGILKPIELQTSKEIEHLFKVNVFGLIELTQQVLPFLKSAHGRIINISSIAGLQAFPFYGSYAASKHALEAFSEALYFELKPYGIHVSLVEPGGFKTEFNKNVEVVSKSAVKPNTKDSSLMRRTVRFESFIEDKSKFSGNAMDVAKLIRSIISAHHPKLRYIIGRDAKIFSMMKNYLPERLKLWLLYFGFRKLIFKE